MVSFKQEEWLFHTWLIGMKYLADIHLISVNLIEGSATGVSVTGSLEGYQGGEEVQAIARG